MKFEEWLKANGMDINTLSQTAMKSLQATWKEECGDGTQAKGATKTKAVTLPVNQTIQASEVLNGDGASEDGMLQARADRVRMRKVETLCAKHSKVNEITLDDGTKVDPMTHAIEAGWAANELEVYLLRASYPKAPAGHVSHALEGDQLQSVLGAAVLQATGYGRKEIESEYDDQTLQAAHQKFKGRIGLQETFLEAAFANGYHGGYSFRSNPHDIIKAAFSSNDISGILSNTANKFIKVGFEKVESAWREVASIRPVNDFKQITTHSLVGDLEYEKSDQLARSSTENLAR